MQKQSLFAAALKYGLLTGFAAIIFSLVMHASGVAIQSSLNYLTYLILIAGIILGTHAYRQQALGDVMPYSVALGMGTLITVFAGAMVAVYTYMLMKYIDPDIVNKILAESEAKLIESGMADEQIEMGMEWTRKFVNPVVSALSALVSYTLIGFILSLITSAFLKRTAPAA